MAVTDPYSPGSESESKPVPGNEKLLSETYHRLRQVARSRLSRERQDHTLQATALVHEAWIRLGTEWHSPDGQAEFIAAMSNVMRRVLVDHARRHLAAKRGGGAWHDPVDDTIPDGDAQSNPEELIAVDEALVHLEKEYPRPASLVRLRYFTGLTIEEAAASLRISPATANRDWVFAKGWIANRIRSDQ